jgi:4-amino-4-deoxy-L-arabinose transferase-like glycosyltransferase
MTKALFQRYFLALCLIVAVGIFLRLPPTLFSGNEAPLHKIEALHPLPKFTSIGFDEGLYRSYVNNLIKGGLGSYPDIVEHYIEVQRRLPGSILPPVRFLYIFTAYLWHLIFQTEALATLHAVAAFFSMLVLVLSATFAWRMKGPACALAVTALMACAPTQIHMSQHALVDGFFTFWALLCLWFFWENLRAPRKLAWLLPYALSWTFLTLTKENAFFVFVGILAIVIANRWLQFGTVTRELLLCMVVGPLLGIVVLIFLAGGVETLITSYRLSVSKNYTLAYAVLTGDGPWHRYLVDLLLVSPVILLLALGTLFRLNLTQKPELFVTVFVSASYLLMCNLKYGMNLRYANMWDFPLRILAFNQITALAALYRSRAAWITAALVALICAVELRQYCILFVQYPLYELVSEGLLRALHILKSPGQ